MVSQPKVSARRAICALLLPSSASKMRNFVSAITPSDAEVVNLKQSSEAAEERARTDLGMIGPKETFYQVVPVASATH